MIYIQLFWSFFLIGLFCFGGGYAAIPLIQSQVVEVNGWLTMHEYTDLITIAEMTPGPVAINAATFTGMQIAGFGGAIVSTLGCIIPSCIIVFSLAVLFYKHQKLSVVQGILKGLRPAVISLIASAGLSITVLAFWGNGNILIKLYNLDFIAVFLFSASLFILRKFKLNPIYIMASCGIISVIIHLLSKLVQQS